MVFSDDAVADLVLHPERVAALLGRARTIAPDGLVGIDQLFDGL